MRLSSAILLVALSTASAAAERLPVHVYTTADGLANGRVIDGTEDARGFLWFATIDGVSRFDGERFETFRTDDGVPDNSCHDVLATRDGAVWVATDGGVARLDPAATGVRPRFTPIGGDDTAFTLLEGAEHLWVGTSAGLAEVDGDRLTAVALAPGHEPYVFAIAEDRDRTLWLGTSDGLYRRLPDGTIAHARFTPAGTADDRVTTLLFDHAGRLWIGAANLGLVAMVPPASGAPITDGASLWEAGGAGLDADRKVRLPAAAGEIVRYTAADGVPDGGVRRLIFEDSRGTMWFGALALTRLEGGRFTTIGAREGFPPEDFAPCLEDRDGNLWFGANTQGLVRLTSHAIVSFDESDGLTNLHALGITEDAAGALVVTTGGHVLDRMDGDHFVATTPLLPDGVAPRAWGWNQVGFVDRDGRWWYPTQAGLARYPAVAHLEDLATTTPTVFTIHDSLPGRDIYRLFQDGAGDVWITTLSGLGLARWERARDRITALGDPLPRSIANAFAEDASGALWIGYDSGQVARLPGRDPAAAQLITVGDRGVEALLFDRAGRLWIATDAGVVRIDDPSSATPALTRYTTRDGLATDQTTALVDDTRGRIYVGTVRGMDRIDPASGEIAHLSTADGLPDDYVMAEHRDRDGRIWVGTQSGLARIEPEDTPPRPPPVAYLTALIAGGSPRPLAMGGATGAPAISLGYDEAQLEITFTSPSFATGTPVRFQTRLEGADDDWSPPSSAREVRYAHLAPGTYRFEVRALIAGVPSAPTGIDVEIRAPLWRRPWFLALIAIALGAIAWRLYRMRVARLVAVERVRTRIATDLHDDLGSSLSRISILAEVAARRSSGDPTVADIGKSARELVDVAADIVWSTDPRRDDLGSLLVRLRTFAGDVLDGKQIAWSLDAPAAPERVHLGPDARRHLFLVLKEAINNAARHSGATRVTIALTVDGSRVRATVRDDGRGLDPERKDGNGLGNMRMRAAQAGGRVEIAAGPDGGTQVTLELPLGA